MLVTKQMQEYPLKNISNRFQQNKISSQINKFNKANRSIIQTYESSPEDIKDNIKSKQIINRQKQIGQESHPKISIFCEQTKHSKIFQNDHKLLTPQIIYKKQNKACSYTKQWHKQIMFPSKQQKNIQKRIQSMLIQQTEKLHRKGKHYYTLSTQYSNTQSFDQTIKSTSSISKNSTLRKYLCEQSLNKHNTQEIKNKGNQSHNSYKSSLKNSQKRISCFNPFQIKIDQTQNSKQKKETQIKQERLINQTKQDFLLNSFMEIAKNIQQVQGSFLTNEISQNPQMLIIQVKKKINQILNKIINQRPKKQTNN